MNLDEESKKALGELGNAINDAVENSARVVEVVEYLRELGYEANFSLKLEIGLAKIDKEDEESEREAELDLTAEDLRTLRRMKISLE